MQRKSELTVTELNPWEQPAEYFDLEPHERTCEYGMCVEPAEFWLICPDCSAREVLCSPHAKMIDTATVGDVIIFDLSCNHFVLQRKCTTERFSKS